MLSFRDGATNTNNAADYDDNHHRLPSWYTDAGQRNVPVGRENWRPAEDDLSPAI